MSAAGLTATAAVSRSPGEPPGLEQVALRPPRDAEVYVEIEAVGLCHADVAANAGDFPVGFPIVLGHEGCGRVLAVGPLVRDLEPGDRVVLTYDHCGRCVRCRAGRPTQCSDYMAHNFPTTGAGVLGHAPDGSAVHGGFFGQSSLATIAVANERNAVRVDTDLPSVLLAPLGCGIQTGTGAVLHVARPSPNDTLVIVGLGAVGFAALIAARSRGLTSIVAVDIDPTRRALAAELGAAATLDAQDPGWGSKVTSCIGAPVDVLIECSGSQVALRPAIESVRTGGRLVLVGAPPFGSTTPVDVAAIVNKSLRIFGTVEGDSRSHEVIPSLVREIEAGRLPIERLVEEHSFLDIADVFATTAAGGGAIKPVLVMPR